jgi:PAS domain S-box-containing protein
MKSMPPMLEQVSATILVAAPLSIADTQGTILWVNQTFCDICGYHFEELTGKNHSILQSGQHDRDFYSHLWQTILAGHAWEGEICNRKKNGDTYWDHVIIIPIQDTSGRIAQFLAYHNDISERKALNEAVKKRAHYQGLLTLLSRSAALGNDLAFILDQFTTVVTYSLDMHIGMIFQHTAAHELTLRYACGINPDEIGKTRIKITDGDIVNYLYNHQEVVSSPDIRRENRFHSHEFLLQQHAPHCVGMMLGNQTHPWGVFVLLSRKFHTIESESFLFMDSIRNMITETIMLHETRKQRDLLQQELQQAKKMEAVGHLASGIAHDFNNILASILGYSSLAMERFAQHGGKLADYLREIENAGLRARDIVAQLSSYGKSDNDQNEPVMLPTLLKGTLKMLRSAIPSSITLDTRIDMNTAAVLIKADEFNQIMLHLLLNARNAMQGKGNLIIELVPQDVNNQTCAACRTPVQGPCACLSILDSSPCPTPEQLTRAFAGEEPSRADLLQASTLVHASNGHILVLPEGDGTRTRVIFPAAQRSAATESKPRAAINTQAHIMIVDDENSVATYLSELLQQTGYQTTLFTDATEAVKAFVGATEKYDLIITDQTMPMLSGFDLAQAMLQVRNNLPIILITGANDRVNENNAEKIGIRGVLSKPLETHKLLECINRLLNDASILND